MNWTAIILGFFCIVLLGILLIRPFDFQHREESKLQRDIDTLKVQKQISDEDKEMYKRYYLSTTIELVNCRESLKVHQADVTPQPDGRALQYVLTTLRETKDSLKAARKIAEKLQPSLFSDPVGFKFEDEFVRFGVRAYGSTNPLEGKVEVQYEMTDYELLKKQIIYKDREIPIYVTSAYVYAELGIGRNWKQQKYQMPFGVGLFADLSKVFSVDVQALRGVWIGNGIDVSSNAILRYKF